jgi:hypothetical protein
VVHNTCICFVKYYVIRNDNAVIDSNIFAIRRLPLAPENCDRIVRLCSSLNLCQFHPNLRQNLHLHQTAKQFFVNIVKELPVMELSARVYVLLIVTIKTLIDDFIRLLLKSLYTIDFLGVGRSIKILAAIV